MKKIIIFFFAINLALIPFAVDAGCCGCDPVYEYSNHGEVISAVWVRDEACVATGEIIDTLQAGEVVQITHRTDGWYKVISPRGKIGWSGEQFFKMTDKPLTSSSISSSSSFSSNSSGSSSTSETSYSLTRLKGHILLQVENNGEAHYYYPDNNKRYYLGRPADAFAIMRELGLGIKHSELAGYLGYKFPSRLSGKIMLNVEQNGEAYYVYPKDLKGYYLGRPADAFAIMRELGLGITNSNLDLISTANISTSSASSSSSPSSSSSTSSATGLTLLPTSTDPAGGPKFVSSGSQIAGTGNFQKGSVPSGFNYAVINQYVLDRINRERTSRGKPAIIFDQRMVDTASVWGEEMYKQGQITHTRLPVNMIAREWVWQNFKIEFREDWGWLYENIGGGSYNRSQGINESIMNSMDSLFDFYMSEESYNGIHYQTIMHDHLTHVGVGFYFDGNNDSGKLYTVLHYGGLYGQVPVIDKIW